MALAMGLMSGEARAASTAGSMGSTPGAGLVPRLKNAKRSVVLLGGALSATN